MAPLLDAYEAAVAANTHIETVDGAAVETGRQLAAALDDVLADPAASPADKTKALYLVPHIMAVLRDLLATPAARKQFGLAAAEQKRASRLAAIKDAAKR